jgi:hypothetical protein
VIIDRQPGRRFCFPQSCAGTIPNLAAGQTTWKFAAGNFNDDNERCARRSVRRLASIFDVGDGVQADQARIGAAGPPLRFNVVPSAKPSAD